MPLVETTMISACPSPLPSARIGDPNKPLSGVNDHSICPLVPPGFAPTTYRVLPIANTDSTRPSLSTSPETDSVGVSE